MAHRLTEGMQVSKNRKLCGQRGKDIKIISNVEPPENRVEAKRKSPVKAICITEAFQGHLQTRLLKASE